MRTTTMSTPSRRAPGLLAALRRDAALRSLPLWLCASFIILLLALSLSISRLATAAPEVARAGMVTILWCAVAPFLASGEVRRRCRGLDLTLPLSARWLWLAHMTAVLLATATILAVAIAPVALVASPSPGELVRLAAQLGVGLALAVAVLQAASPASAAPPLSWGYVLRMVVSLGGVLAILRFLSALPLLWTVVPLGLAAAFAVGTYAFLPATFTLMPRAAASAGRPGRIAAPKRSAAVIGWRHRWKILHLVSGGRLSWLGWPLIFLVGMMIAFLTWDLPIERVLAIVCLLFLLTMFMFPILRLARLPLLDPLPIHRRALFAALILPSAGILALGYAALTTLVALALPPSDTLAVMPAALLLLGLPWLLLLALVFCTLRASVPAWVREAVAGLILFLIFFVMPPVIYLLAAGASLHELVVRTAASRAGTLAVWLVSTLLLLGGYVLARASFERIELSARPGGQKGVLGLGEVSDEEMSGIAP